MNKKRRPRSSLRSSTFIVYTFCCCYCAPQKVRLFLVYHASLHFKICHNQFDVMKIPFLLFLTPSLPFSSTTSPSSTSGFATVTSSSSPLDKRCFRFSKRINGEPREIRKEGQTGWNHNLPKEDSPFWGNPESQNDSTNDSSSSAPLRTGWLHNTQSPSEK